MIKENSNLQKILKPKLSFRMSPNNTKDIRNHNTKIYVNKNYSVDSITDNDPLDGGVTLAFEP